ncbi:MAG: DNA-binding response regulator [Anaerolineae bacterium]|nr:response regulator transcription factor [Anaerolineae bacterium]MCQ3975587.1 DNA-binding response regulator [Anaerolineae bacterium]
MSQARILLADDHELFREGLAALLNIQPDLTVAGQAGDGFEALTLARDLQPDLIVMDISMPICDGLEATRLIRATPTLLEAKILVLTVHEKDDKLLEAIKAGANGYLLKSTGSADFLKGIRGALAGEAVLPPKLAVRLLEEFARLANHPQLTAVELSATLTQREHEILSRVAGGASDKEIAAQLFLSRHTVKTHLRSILSKLHAVNRRQAAQLAVQLGLVKDHTKT